MIVPGQTFEIGMSGKTIKHYRELGYDVKDVSSKLIVPTEHLTKGSHAIVKMICDYCGCEFERQYKKIWECKSKDGLDSCKKCMPDRVKDTMLNKYGVEHSMHLEETKQKLKNTMLERYGVEHCSQIPGFKEKVIKTNLEKYGAEHYLKTKEGMDKLKKTNFERYGVENAMQVKEIHEKAVKTIEKKYGVPYLFMSENFAQKTHDKMIENGNGVPTSSQQIKLYEIIKKQYPNAILNYFENPFSLDVFIEINGTMLDIEYDAWYWHDQQKDIRRDKVLKNRGYKILRIRSGHKIPDESFLFEAIDYLLNTEHTFKEIFLDDWKEKDKEVSA